MTTKYSLLSILHYFKDLLLKSTVILVLADVCLCTTDSVQATDSDKLFFPPQSARRYAHSNPDAYFGYSVASYVGQSQAFCLIGAPRAEYHQLGIGKPKYPTGLVYRLELDPILPSCSVVPIATTDEMREEYAGSETFGESSWLGGSVAAASNSVDGIQLGCDPRYISKPVPMPGTNHSRFDTGGRHPTSVQAQTPLVTGQCALYTGASMAYTVVDACSSQEEGSCLAGFSSDVEAGQQIGEAFVALGMPGSYLTEGNVFLGRYRGRELISATRLKTSPQDLKHKGFNLGYAVHLSKLIISHDTRLRMMLEAGLPELYTVLQGGQSQPLEDYYSLLVTSPFWVDNEYQGLVMILDQNLDFGGITYLKDKWSHIGSFFGYSLTTADLDGNGLADIIVGAPYFTEKHEDKGDPVVAGTRGRTVKATRDVTGTKANTFLYDETGQNLWRQFAPDVGRVYIFYGHQPSANRSDSSAKLARPDYTSRPPVVLQGLRRARGRFGHALVNLGDVDGDGTEDIAISCPYCSDPKKRKDKGAVLVYLGRKDTTIKDKPFQVIWPADLPRDNPQAECGMTFDPIEPRTFKGFGWSISGGVDLDSNHAPDLMVGDFESSQVVLLPARNTLWFDNPRWRLPLTETLTWSDPNGKPCGSQCTFRIQLSVNVHGRRSLFDSSLTFKLRIVTDLDANIEKVHGKRLRGQNMLQQASDSWQAIFVDRLETVVTLSPGENDDGQLTLLDVQFRPDEERVREMLWKPAQFNVSIIPSSEVSPDSTGGPTPWLLHPFLGMKHFASPPMHFNNPECGVDNVCNADLQVRLIGHDGGTGEEEGRIVYFRERVSQRNLTVLVRNMGENAYAAKLRLEIPLQFSFTTPPELICQTSIATEGQVAEVLCNLGDPLPYTGSNFRYFVFQLNTAGAFRTLDEPALNDQASHDSSKEEDMRQAPGTDTRSKDLKAANSQEDQKNRLRRDVLQRNWVTITAEVISGNTDADYRSNKVSISYQLRLSAAIEISSSALDRTTIDSRNYTVQFYEMQRVHPDTIGPEFKHIYLVSNAGPSPVEELWVNVTLPLQTRDGEHLLYLLDQVRYQAEDGGPALYANMAPEVISAEGLVRGMCITPKWALNPFKFKVVNRGRRRPQVDTLSEPIATIRQRRSFEIGSIESEEEEESTRHQGELPNGVRMTRSVRQSARKHQEVVKCGYSLEQLGEPVCATVKCRIDQLSRGDAVRVVLRGHIWADTFFRHKISDFSVVSEASSELKPVSFGIPVHGNLTVQPMAISQNFVFDGIKVPLFRKFPLWPIILGVILGLALLACIFFGMWKCGFFQRKRGQDRTT